jgi:hypothetical protein
MPATLFRVKFQTFPTSNRSILVPIKAPSSYNGILRFPDERNADHTLFDGEEELLKHDVGFRYRYDG